MDAIPQASASPSKHQHKQSTSSVLKSIMPQNHQRNPSAKAITTGWNEECGGSNGYMTLGNPMLPPEQPNSRQHLREASGNRSRVPPSPRASEDMQKENNQGHEENRKIASSTSFMTFKEKEKGRGSKQRSEKQEEKQMKKSKSSTSLAAFFSRPRSKSVKVEESRQQMKDEDERPLRSVAPPPPIWAQFATQDVGNISSTTKVPLNDSFGAEEEMARYTPRDYSPSKQRNFQDVQQPTLSRRREAKPRPKSECLTQGPTPTSFAETISGLRRSSREKGPAKRSSQRRRAPQDEGSSQKSSYEDKRSSRRPSIARPITGDISDPAGPPVVSQESRVKAAVAAFNGKSKELPKEPTQNSLNSEFDPSAIENAFESLLEARNVPQHTRDKMRSLDTNIKADFVNKHKSISESTSSAEGLSLQPSRPNTGKRSKTTDASFTSAGDCLNAEPTVETPKKSRPRSLTFTLSKSDLSPSKKQKSERPSSHQRTKSGGLTPSASSTSLKLDSAGQGFAFWSKASRPAVPDDYISYLKKVQQPEVVEVGKVHKLRQLLRNETVDWVNTFIVQGGMMELVELLYRINKVEWRVEHEDTLLHETLLCLKALSTTSSAHCQLSEIHSTLFPTLLGMLFDKEKKGPSEFSTRNIIITLLSTYLCDAPTPDLTSRARIILAYLRDPTPPEEAQPPGFITSIYHPRPYRIWHKELDSVIKEVFWIFLHPVNIIPHPTLPPASTYTERHFPREHPPVPAAPYIGGVEWDATNYLTAHIDLLNGIIASLPTREERNALRRELRDSGFEKAMGVSLRTCKEKLYGCVHEALSTWVGAAVEDEWEHRDVKQGPKVETNVKAASSKKSPKKADAAPKLEMSKLDAPPKLDMLKLELSAPLGHSAGVDDGGWL